MSRHYLVTWVIDIQADTPEEAARDARRAQTRRGTTAVVFDVTDKGTGRTVSIDLQNRPIPVIFRVDSRDGVVSAIFPTIPGLVGDPTSFMVYEHVGQHGTGCKAWLEEHTRSATPRERRSLLKELLGIYGSQGKTLDVRSFFLKAYDVEREHERVKG